MEKDIVFNSTGYLRLKNLKAKTKEYALQLQELIADMVKKEQFDLKTL